MKVKRKSKETKPEKGKRKTSDESFFVEVVNYNDIKRDILESMKLAIESLHNYERYKLIKKQRIEVSSKLSSELKEISRLASLLRSKLPTKNVRVKAEIKPKRTALHEEQKQAHHKKQEKPAEQAAHPKQATELEKLESELKAIEEKLQSLN